MKNKYKYHFLLLIIGALNLIFLNYLLQLNSQQFIGNDSLNYVESAKFLYNDFQAHYYRPIAMAFITGLPLLISNSDSSMFDFSLFINIISWFSTIVLLFEITKYYLVPKKAFLITGCYIFLVGNSTILFDLLSESIYIFFIIMAYYLILQYYKSLKFSYLSIALFLIITSMLIRPGAKFFAIIMVLFFIKIIYKNIKKVSSVFIYAAFFLVLLQCYAIKNTYGNFKISYIDSYTIYNYLGAKSNMLKNNESLKVFNTSKRDKYLTQFSYKQADIVAKNDFIEQLKNNLPNLILAYIDDLHHNTTDGNSRILLSKNVEKKASFESLKTIFFYISKIQNIIITLFGFSLALLCFFKNLKRDKFSFLIAGFILYTILISGVSCAQGDRFHLVTYPFVLVLIAKFWYKRKSIKPFSEPLQK